MMIARLTGTAARLLCLTLLIGLATSCDSERHYADSVSVPPQTPDELRKEFQDNVNGVMNSPSMQPGSGQAGAPVNVSPYVKSAPSHQGHDMHDMPEAGDRK